jgi:hypothetical protein
MTIVLTVVLAFLGLGIIGAIIQLCMDGFKLMEFINFMLICFLFGLVFYILRHGGITLK